MFSKFSEIRLKARIRFAFMWSSVCLELLIVFAVSLFDLQTYFKTAFILLNLYAHLFGKITAGYVRKTKKSNQIISGFNICIYSLKNSSKSTPVHTRTLASVLHSIPVHKVYTFHKYLSLNFLHYHLYNRYTYIIHRAIMTHLKIPHTTQ